MTQGSHKKPLDLCGLSCAFILAEIDRALTEGATVVEFLCDHPTSINETIPLYCRRHGYHLEVTPEIYPLDRHVYRVRIVR